jgi:hypothetical protein
MLRAFLLTLLLGLATLAGAQSPAAPAAAPAAAPDPAAAPAAAAAPAPGPNDACLMCHSDLSAKSASGKPIGVDPAKFAASVHGSMQLPCTACHADVSADKVPHGEVKKVECANCHEKAVKEYSTTIHGRARAGGNNVAATCTNCHGSHDILRSKDPASRTNHDNLETTCGACHGNDAVVEKAHLPGGNIVSKYHDSIHGQAIAKKGTTKDTAPTCTNCHGAHDMRPKSDPQSRVARANIPDTCGGCHFHVREVWGNSQHGKLRAANVLQAPGCNDCHSAHSIQSPRNVPQWKLQVINECGTCHLEYVATYRDTFHGQVTQLGYTQVATCSSCHSAHEVLPKEDPMSKVSDKRRLSTCQTCHPKANANFAMYDPHANRHRREGGQILFFTGKFMDVLLLGVFAFFGTHTLLWFFRSLKEVRARRAKESHEEKH